MNIKDFRECDDTRILTVTPAKPDRIRVGMPVWFVCISGRFFLTSMSRSSHMEIRGDTETQYALRELSGASGYLAEVVANDSNEVVIMVRRYHLTVNQSLSICLPERVKKRLVGKYPDLEKGLARMFSMRLSSQTEAYVIGIRNKDEDVEAKGLPDAILVGGFENGYIQLRCNEKQSQPILTGSYPELKCPDGSYRYYLLTGSLQFVDDTHAQETIACLPPAVSQIVSQSP